MPLAPPTAAVRSKSSFENVCPVTFGVHGRCARAISPRLRPWVPSSGFGAPSVTPALKNDPFARSAGAVLLEYAFFIAFSRRSVGLGSIGGGTAGVIGIVVTGGVMMTGATGGALGIVAAVGVTTMGEIWRIGIVGDIPAGP